MKYSARDIELALWLSEMRELKYLNIINDLHVSSSTTIDLSDLAISKFNRGFVFCVGY